MSLGTKAPWPGSTNVSLANWPDNPHIGSWPITRVRQLNKFKTFATALLTFVLSVGLLIQPARAEWPEGSAAIGAQDHPKILAQFGGEIEDDNLIRYVQTVGSQMIALTAQADEIWTITVLDSPVVNAFALPGGYVYVTRGLLAIANNEAELAGVLGHEIAHMVLGHSENRAKWKNNVGLGVIIGTVLGGLFGGGEGAADAIELGAKLAEGYMARHSKKEEFAADRLGVQLLVKAGYNPYAQADFLDQLAANEALENQVSGQQYNPNRVDFFASHPATGKRTRKAIAEAAQSGADLDTGLLNEPAYLRHINGMVYGDTAREGFVRGLTFSHPEMRFTFTVPTGFILENATSQVSAENHRGARFVLDGDAPWDGDLTDYISDHWVPAIQEIVEVSNFGRLKKLTINGLQAASATADIQTHQGPRQAQLTAIRFGEMTIRITTLSLLQDDGSRRMLQKATRSFRELSEAEIADLSPYFLRVTTVVPGDTISQLAATMPLTEFQAAQFRALNGYRSDEAMVPGDLIKIVE